MADHAETAARSWRLVLAGSIALLGVVAAFVAIHNSRGRETIELSGGHRGELVLSSGNLIGVEGRGAVEVVQRITQTIERQVRDASLPQGDALVDDTRRILNAWLAGTSDEYLAYLQSNGDDPPPAALWSDAMRREDVWAAGTRALREARFDPAGVTLRTSFQNGKAVPLEFKTVTGWRFDKLSGHEQAFPSPEALERDGTTVHEILVPMRSTGLSYGAQYDGLLAMSYVQDTATKRWTLVAVSVYGLPEGDTARIPPF